MSAPPRRIALPFRYPRKGDVQLVAQGSEVPFDPVFPADHDVVVIGQPFARDHTPQQFAETSLHAIAGHGVPDPLGHRDSVALAETRVRHREKHEAGLRHADASIRGQEVRALADHR